MPTVHRFHSRKHATATIMKLRPHRTRKATGSPSSPTTNAECRMANRSHSSFVIRHSKFRAAFTLAEVLAAMAFMAILIPIVAECLTIASRAGEVAQRKSEAARVAERILNENIVTTNWNQSAQSGTVEDGV